MRRIQARPEVAQFVVASISDPSPEGFESQGGHDSAVRDRRYRYQIAPLPGAVRNVPTVATIFCKPHHIRTIIHLASQASKVSQCKLQMFCSLNEFMSSN